MFRKGDKIGPYTLLDKLGRGGFGVVWLAEKRASLVVTKVALKMPNDDDIDLDAVRREAALWAHVSGHPNVLPIIDADIYNDQVVIVSEYAPDGSLGTWLKRNGGRAPSISDAIAMTLGILAGLDHLHSRMIIHRDLKPANILLQGRTPRLADFGLARVMKSTSQSGSVSGTYSYMPPETFNGIRSEQTDIYSVGVILYEMLVGKLPYPQATDAALIGAILHGIAEPLPDFVSIPLKAVIERAIDKDPNKRFRTAVEMLSALHDASLTNQSFDNYSPVTEVMPSYLRSEILSHSVPQPIEVEKPSPSMLSGIEPQSYKTNASNMPATDPSLSPISKEIEDRFIDSQKPNVTPVIGVPQSFERPASGKTTSPDANLVSIENLQMLTPNMSSLESPSQQLKDTKPSIEISNPNKLFILIGTVALVCFLLAAFIGVGIFVTSRLIGGSPESTSENQTPDKTSGDKTTKKEAVLTGRLLRNLNAQGVVLAVAISADGKLAVSGSDDSKVRFWKYEESSSPVILSGHSNIVGSVAISPDGQTIASGSDDKTIRLWNVSDGKLLRELKGHSAYVFRVSFSRDGKTVVSQSGDKTIRFWNVNTGEEMRKFELPNEQEVIVSISPDLQFVAFYLEETKRVRIWSIEKNESMAEMQGDKFKVNYGAFSPDNSILALGSKDGVVRLFRVKDGGQIGVLQGQNKENGDIAFNADGAILAVAYENGSICLWNARDAKVRLPLKTLEGHTKFVNALGFSGDNRILASGSEDKTLRLWEIEGK